MASDTNSELLYKQTDRANPKQIEDCYVFVNGMLNEILPEEQLKKSFMPFDIQDAESLVAYGLLKFDEKPPQENADPHKEPTVVLYLSEQTKSHSAKTDKQSYPFFVRHVGLFDGYSADRKTVMVISKDSYDGDVYRHTIEATDYGKETRFLKMNSIVSVMEHLRKHGIQSIQDLNEKYKEIRKTIMDQGSELKDADLEAKHIIQSKYRLRNLDSNQD